MNADETQLPIGRDRTNSSGEASVGRSGQDDSGEIVDRNFNIQRTVLFNEIAGGTAEVIIEHEGQRYRLRATRNGRLLLNK